MTYRQCFLRSHFTIARRGLFFTIIGYRSYVNLHDNLCIHTHTFWPVVGRFIVNKWSKRGVDNALNVTIVIELKIKTIRRILFPIVVYSQL